MKNLLRATTVAAILASAFVAPAMAQTTDRGKTLFMQCRACHTLTAGEPNKVGPNLSRFLTRAPLSARGFRYSPAFVAAKTRWTRASLDRWLERPSVFISGNTMAFGGMRSAEDRAVLIAWLATATNR